VPLGDRLQTRSVKRVGAASEREERSEPDPIRLTVVQQPGILLPMHVEVVLDGRDRRDRTRLGELRPVHVTHPEVPDQALLAEPGQRLEALADRFA